MIESNINSPRRKNSGAKASIWVIVALGAVLLAGIFGFHAVERYFLVQSAQQSQSTLRLAVAGLRGALRRFEPLPALIAEKPSIKLLLSKSSEPELSDAVNLELKRIAEDVGASDVYVIDNSGHTVAASNFDQPHSFMGRSYAYRPYFQQARDGGLGRFFALGTASLKRGYYFAAPVTFLNKIVGVVTVKLAVDSFEADWQGNESDLLITDSFGITFMSSRPDWHFKTLQALEPEAVAQIEASRQYPPNQLGLLNLTRSPLGDEGAELFEIASPYKTENFVATAMGVPEVGWTFHVLVPTKGAYQQTYIAITIAVLLLLSTSAIAAFLLQRRARLFERINAQRSAQELLERRVQERTSDLNDANTQLKQEVEERKLAERQLRKSQADLVQAGKLAALGQMSAALSHEFNQPLTAVKTYAENAATYLDRDRPEDARENISRISQMADRMAAIGKHLRNFARRPQEKLGPVPLWTVVDDALEILSGKLRSRNAVVELDEDRPDIWVKGGQIRLQQVLVNLISNALDATAEDLSSPSIEVSIEALNDRVKIRIRDFGPGLSDEVIGLVFDPFFTTKGPGKGLGLGLSISYNIIKDFGGHLLAENHIDGGAVFTIDLASAEKLIGAAAE